MYPLKTSDSLPCKFFLAGDCRFSDHCKFSHIQPIDKVTQPILHTPPINATTRNNQVCSFFSSPGGCRNGNSCRFKHIPQNCFNEEEKIAFRSQFCECKFDNFEFSHFGSPTPSRQRKNRPTWAILAKINFIDVELALEFPLALDHHTKDGGSHYYFYSFTSNVVARLRPLPPSDSGAQPFLLEGNPKHEFCILTWLEYALGLFTCSFTQIDSSKPRKYLEYTSYIPGSPLPPLPLAHRLFQVFKQNNPQNTSKTVRAALPFVEPLDKSLYLKFAMQYDVNPSESNHSPSSDQDSQGSDESTDSSEETQALIEAPVDDNIQLLEFPAIGFQLTLGSSSSVLFDEFITSTDQQGFLLASGLKSHGGLPLRLVSDATTMLQGNSAGCGQVCQYSEALSYEVLYHFFPNLKFLLSEMEVEYTATNPARIDYLCSISNSINIGVSVTRAWNGGNAPYKRKDASALLKKKLKGLNAARSVVRPSHTWQKQILHIWSPSSKITSKLRRQARKLPSQLIACTLIIITTTQFSIPPQFSYVFRNDKIFTQ